MDFPIQLPRMVRPCEVNAVHVEVGKKGGGEEEEEDGDDRELIKRTRGLAERIFLRFSLLSRYL